MDLRSHWYPIAFSASVEKGKVYGLRIFGEPICVYRTPSGRLACLVDRCASRGDALSQGRLEGENLQTLYHGWEYDLTGKVVRIPSVDSSKCQSMNLSVYAFPVCEKYGRVWIWTGKSVDSNTNTPSADTIPNVLFFNCKNEWQLLTEQTWDIDICPFLALENMSDISHAPFVHHGTVSNRKQAQLLKPTQDKLIPLNDLFQSNAFLGLNATSLVMTLKDGTSIEQCFFGPCHIQLKQYQGNQPMVRVSFAVVPISKNHCRVLTATYAATSHPISTIAKMPGVKSMMKWVSNKGFYQDYQVLKEQMKRVRMGADSLGNGMPCDTMSLLAKSMTGASSDLSYEADSRPGDEYETHFVNGPWFGGWCKNGQKSDWNPNMDADYVPPKQRGVDRIVYMNRH